MFSADQKAAASRKRLTKSMNKKKALHLVTTKKEQLILLFLDGCCTVDYSCWIGSLAPFKHSLANGKIFEQITTTKK